MSADRNDDGVQFRLAVAADLPAVAALTERAYAPYTEAFGAPPLPVTEDYAPHIADGGVWLLEISGETAGLLVLEREPGYLMIFSVAVAPEFQGRGLGLKLLAFADEKAREAGYREVRLYTNARMERNIALYSRYGYRETARRAHPERAGWIIVDMARDLG